MFDIVILVGPNDTNQVQDQLLYTRKNIIGYRNIYLITCDPIVEVEGCILINETIFPFTIRDIKERHGVTCKNGWYLQQLLKLYTSKVISDILDDYLVLDADTYFLKPTAFQEENKNLYNVGSEYHKPYFEHMKRVHPSFKRTMNVSGICHHMIMNKKIINELFQLVEEYHNSKKFWEVFLDEVAVDQYNKSGASEYELYFNYIFAHHVDKIKIRKLNWTNRGKLILNKCYDYISVHWYIR